MKHFSTIFDQILLKQGTITALRAVVPLALTGGEMAARGIAWAAGLRKIFDYWIGYRAPLQSGGGKVPPPSFGCALVLLFLEEMFLQP